jgi:hypothetical protein
MSNNGTEQKFNNFLAMQFSEDGKQMQIQIAGAQGVPLNKGNLLIALHTLHIAVNDYLKEQEEKLKSKIISTVPQSIIDRIS